MYSSPKFRSSAAAFAVNGHLPSGFRKFLYTPLVYLPKGSIYSWLIGAKKIFQLIIPSARRQEPLFQ